MSGCPVAPFDLAEAWIAFHKRLPKYEELCAMCLRRIPM